jgi:hypothetical protein
MWQRLEGADGATAQARSRTDALQCVGVLLVVPAFFATFP